MPVGVYYSQKHVFERQNKAIDRPLPAAGPRCDVNIRRIPTCLPPLVAVLCCGVCISSVAATELDDARRLLLTGRYEEAHESYSALTGRFPFAARLGAARCLAATGQYDEAIERLSQVTGGAKQTLPDIHAELAYFFLEKGDYQASQNAVDVILADSSRHPLALWVQAELHRRGGRLDHAAAAYRQLAALRETSHSGEAESLIWIGRAIAQLARWDRDPRQFDYLVNSLHPRAIELDANCWQAHADSGRLFAEKYNQAQATDALQAALRINPRAAEVHVALGCLALRNFEFQRATAAADRALQINPQLVQGLQLKADIAFAHLRPVDAMKPLEHARTRNPIEEATLGRLLAAYVRIDGLNSFRRSGSRATLLMEAAAQRNPHCGRLFEAAGHGFNLLRIFPLAADFYHRAVERLPQLVAARGELGMIQMRLAREAEARETLEKAFEIDPFNVRVKNTLEVLDLLDGYAVLETDHFVIKFDRGQDQRLATYAAQYLEQDVYPDLVRAFDYEPSDKTVLEIFSRQGGTSGHGWFSARMVGLPFVGTVGACAGKMFAITSPGEGKAFNWARVLRHEFVHVINLQQTNFLVPHWFTEALAVRNERGGYPAQWDAILQKYAADDQLFDLTSIHLGFVRPTNSQRWSLAYFQALLYADFIVALAGDQALQSMLNAYAGGASTEQVLRQVLDRSLADFEREYREFLHRRITRQDFASIDSRPSALAELRQALNNNPNDVRVLAQLAAALMARGENRRARQFAEQATGRDTNQPLANYVLVRLLQAAGEDDEARRRLDAGLDMVSPYPPLLELAAKWSLQAGQLDRAERLYRLGKARFPAEFHWTKGLARVLLAKQDEEGLAQTLPAIADRESDNILVARKLTQLALRRRDYSEAARWANRVLHVDVNDPSAHADLAEALAGQGKTAAAMRELRVALRLAPGQAAWEQRIKELEGVK